jgi:hypothetical protein
MFQLLPNPKPWHIEMIERTPAASIAASIASVAVITAVI